MSVTVTGPDGPAPVAVTVPRLAYWPATLVPVAVQVMSSPGARVATGQDTATPWSSVTTMPVSGTLPVFVTR